MTNRRVPIKYRDISIGSASIEDGGVVTFTFDLTHQRLGRELIEAIDRGMKCSLSIEPKIHTSGVRGLIIEQETIVIKPPRPDQELPPGDDTPYLNRIQINNKRTRY